MNKTAREIKEKEYERTLRVLKYKTDVFNPENPLIEKLKELLYYFGEHYRYVHNCKWRAIVEIVLEDGKEGKVVFHGDIQSANGGGSWALAKHKALEYLDYTAPMNIDEIKSIIEYSTVGKTEMAKSIMGVESSNQLTEVQRAWIVDVDNGPGLAPGYGGIKIPVKILYRGERPDNAGVLLKQYAWIKASFSGAKDWQDLCFAFQMISCAINAIKDYDESIRVSYDLETLLEDSSVAFWADHVRLR